MLPFLNRYRSALLLTIGLFCYVPLFLAAPDSKMAVAQTLDNRKVKANQLLKQGLQKISTGQFQRALQFLEEALIGFRSIGDRNGQAITLGSLGNAYSALSENEKAIGFHQQAFSIFKEIGDLKGQATALRNVGAECTALDQYDRAVDFYQQALSIYKDMGDSVGQAEVFSDLGIAYSSLEQYEKAIDFSSQALSIYKDVGNRTEQARVLMNLGSSYSALKQYEKAIEFYQQALPAYKSIDDRQRQAVVLMGLGIANRFLGRYEKAIDFYQQALIIRTSLKDRIGQSNTLTLLGTAYRKLGQDDKAQNFLNQAKIIKQELKDKLEAEQLVLEGNKLHDNGEFSKALQVYQKAFSLYQKIRNYEGIATILYETGITLFHLRQYQPAIDALEKALISAELLKDPGLESLILNSLGPIYVELGNPTKAIEYYQRGLDLIENTDNNSTKGILLGNLGNACRILGQHDKALSYYQQRLALAKEINDLTGEQAVYLNIASVYHELSNHVKAIEYARLSLTLGQKLSNAYGEILALRNLGFFLFKSNQLIEAEKVLSISISKMEDLLKVVGKSDAYKVAIFEEQSSVYRLLQKVLLKANKQSMALEISEQGRSRVLLELLHGKYLQSPPINSYSNSKISIEQLKKISSQLNSTLVEYSIIEDDSDRDRDSELLIWVVSPTGKIDFRQIDLKKYWQCKDKRCPKSVADSVASTRDSIGLSRASLKPAFDPTVNDKRQKQELQALHRLLIQPIAKLLPQDPNQPVVFVPHKSLFFVPFYALQDASGEYLIKRHTILTVPSIQVLSFTHQRYQQLAQKTRGESSLVVGNPVMPTVLIQTEEMEESDRNVEKLRYLLQQGIYQDNPDKPFHIDIRTYPTPQALPLPELPGSEKEANAVAQILNTKALLGSQAAKTTVIARMSKARIIHLATHGLLGSVITEDGLSVPGAIALAPSISSNKGLLTSEEVLDMKLNAELVVLSACDTGRGKITSDGVIGLSRSFISAGVPSIIVSLWSIPDAPTAELMTEFYTNWQVKKLDKAQALRQAMLTTMKTHPNPRDWAAFTLIGEAE